MTGFGVQNNKKKKRSEPASQTNGEVLLKRAIEHHKRGELVRAEHEYREAIKTNYLHHAVFSNLGIICKNSGRQEEAISLYLKAIKVNPNQPDAYTNLGNLYNELGDTEQALATTLKSIELKPDNADAQMNLGNIYKKLGKLDEALACTNRSLRLKPDNPNAYINLGGIYQELGNLQQALATTHKSLELKFDNPTALLKLGSIYKDLGNLDQALASTHQSLEFDPNNANAHMNLGKIYKDLGNLNQALDFTLRSLKIKPDNPDALINLGNIYKVLERIEDAKSAIKQATKIITKDSPILTSIFDFYDSLNEEELLEKTLIDFNKNFSSKSMRVQMYEARVLFRRKEYKASWARLPTLKSASEHLQDWFSKSKYHAFRAQIAEKNHCYDIAYSSFEASQIDPLYKSINYKKQYHRMQEYMSLSKKISKDRSFMVENAQLQSDSCPVFLIGFPRSGTTLLDTILRSHFEIEVLEEKDPLAVTENFGINNMQSKISNFDSLKEDDLNTLRKTYLKRLKFHSKSKSKIKIDKLPLNTTAIPLINLLFPHAKVIFALRHPCDSILSCFQQTFKPNTAMANFTTLERSVNYYEQVMNGWATYNKNLNIDYTVSKYEDLLDNFDESVFKVLKHLDLEWDQNVKDYRNTAINRGHINTPSSSQVIQPLYKSSVGRWKNYHKYFIKHMDKLNPWIDYFGYNA